MSRKMEYSYDKVRVVRYTSKQASTQIIITKDAWERAETIDLLQEGVTHILEQEPIEQVNKGYGIKYEPTFGGWVFHTSTDKYLFASETSGNRTPGILLFDSLKKPAH